jgi:hypothetical protein
MLSSILKRHDGSKEVVNCRRASLDYMLDVYRRTEAGEREGITANRQAHQYSVVNLE